MRADNAEVLAARLGDLVSESKTTISFLNKYKHAEDVVTTLSAQQKADAMTIVAGMATNIASAYQLAAAAFTASETIEIPAEP